MNDIRKLKDQQRDKHPGFDNYLECMTRALFAGLSAFTLGLLLSLERKRISIIHWAVGLYRLLKRLLHPKTSTKALPIPIKDEYSHLDNRRKHCSL